MDDCIFCKIVKGEIPSYKLYEDDQVISFLDAFPGCKGHTLIIPKQHYQDIFDIPEELYQKVLDTTRKMANILKSTFDCEGMNLLQNSGRASGQAVFHLHVHLFPRWSGDKTLGSWKASKSDPDNMKKLQEQILAFV